MRTAFIRTLGQLAQQDPGLLLLTGDLGYRLFDDFRAQYPGQYLNMGVAESNMVSVSAGLALEGKRPFVYSIASFLTMRPYEHIRNDICFHKARVVLVAAGGGFSYGANGASHHALTDIALMRVLPEMNVFAPADVHETVWSVKTAYEQAGPSYIRLGRGAEPAVHAGALEGKDIRQGIVLREGDELAILASGFILPQACRVADELAKRGHSVRLISFPLIKPLGTGLVVKAFEECSRVFTVEEHGTAGGFSAAVMELALARGLRADKLCPITALETAIYETGSHEFLRRRAGLDTNGILSRMEKAIC